MAIGITKINSDTIRTGDTTPLTFSGAVAAGSTLVAGGFDFNSTAPTTAPAISDTVNGSWTVKRFATLSGTNGIEVWIATFENTASGTPTVTWNPAASNADMGGWFIAEITGATTPTSVDVVPAASQTTGLTPSIASGTLAQANEILIAVMTGDTNTATVTIVGDAAGGYTDLVNQPDNGTSQMGAAQYKIVASASSDTADWTITDVGGTGKNKVSILLSIKEAAGGGGATASKPYTLTLLGMN